MLKVKVDHVTGNPLQLTKPLDDDDPISNGRYSDFSTSDAAASEESDSAVADSGESGTSISEAPNLLEPETESSGNLTTAKPHKSDMDDSDRAAVSVQDSPHVLRDAELTANPETAGSGEVCVETSEDEVHLQLELDGSDTDDHGFFAAEEKDGTVAQPDADYMVIHQPSEREVVNTTAKPDAISDMNLQTDAREGGTSVQDDVQIAVESSGKVADGSETGELVETAQAGGTTGNSGESCTSTFSISLPSTECMPQGALYNTTTQERKGPTSQLEPEQTVSIARENEHAVRAEVMAPTVVQAKSAGGAEDLKRPGEMEHASSVHAVSQGAVPHVAAEHGVLAETQHAVTTHIEHSSELPMELGCDTDEEHTVPVPLEHTADASMGMATSSEVHAASEQTAAVVQNAQASVVQSDTEHASSGVMEPPADETFSSRAELADSAKAGAVASVAVVSAGNTGHPLIQNSVESVNAVQFIQPTDPPDIDATPTDLQGVFPASEHAQPSDLGTVSRADLTEAQQVEGEHINLPESAEDVGTVTYVVDGGLDGEPGSEYYIVEGDVPGLTTQGDGEEGADGGQLLLINVSGEEELENSESYMNQMNQVIMTEALQTSSPTEPQFDAPDTLEDIPVQSQEVVEEVVEVEVPYARGSDIGDMPSLDYAMQHGLGADGHYLDDMATEPSDLPDTLTNDVLDKYTTTSKESVVVEKIASQYEIPVIKNTDREEEGPMVSFGGGDQTDAEAAVAAAAAAAKADPLSQQALSTQMQQANTKKKRRKDSTKAKNRKSLKDGMKAPVQGAPGAAPASLYPDLVNKMPLMSIDGNDKAADPQIPQQPAPKGKKKKLRRRKLSPVQRQHPTIATMLNSAPMYPPPFLLLPRPATDAEKLAEEALAGMGELMTSGGSMAGRTTSETYYSPTVSTAVASDPQQPPKPQQHATNGPVAPTTAASALQPVLPNSAQYPHTANAITQALAKQLPTDASGLPILPGGLGQPGTAANPTYSQITAPPKKRARSLEFETAAQSVMPLHPQQPNVLKPKKSPKRQERLPLASSIATMVEGMISDVFLESVPDSSKVAQQQLPHHMLKPPAAAAAQRHASYPPAAGTAQPQFVSPLQSPGAVAASQALVQESVSAAPAPGLSPNAAMHAMFRNLLSSDVDLTDETQVDQYMRNWRPTGRFQCHFCPYSSVTKNYLFRHWLVNHNTLEAYKCGYCDKRATYRDSITRHQSINHKNMDKWVLIDAIIQERTFLTFQQVFGLQVSLSEKTHDSFGFLDHADDETIKLGQEAVQKQQNANDGIRRKSASIIYERTFDDTSKSAASNHTVTVPVSTAASASEEVRLNHVGAAPPLNSVPTDVTLALPVPVGSGSTTVRSHSMTLPVRNPSKLLREIALPQNPEDRSIIETAHYAVSNVPMVRKSNSMDTNSATKTTTTDHARQKEPHPVKSTPGPVTSVTPAPYYGTEQETALNLSNKVPPPYPGFPLPGLSRLPLTLPLPLPPHLQPLAGLPPPAQRVQGSSNKMFVTEQTKPTEIVVRQEPPVNSIKEALLKPPRHFSSNAATFVAAASSSTTAAGHMVALPRAATGPVRLPAPPRPDAAPARPPAPHTAVAVMPPGITPGLRQVTPLVVASLPPAPAPLSAAAALSTALPALVPMTVPSVPALATATTPRVAAPVQQGSKLAIPVTTPVSELQPWLGPTVTTKGSVFTTVEPPSSQDFSVASAASVLKSLSELSAKPVVSIADRRPPAPPDASQLPLVSLYGLKIPEVAAGTAVPQPPVLGPMLSPPFRPDLVAATAPNFALIASAFNTTTIAHRAAATTTSPSTSAPTSKSTPSSASV